MGWLGQGMTPWCVLLIKKTWILQRFGPTSKSFGLIAWRNCCSSTQTTKDILFQSQLGSLHWNNKNNLITCMWFYIRNSKNG